MHGPGPNAKRACADFPEVECGTQGTFGPWEGSRAHLRICIVQLPLSLTPPFMGVIAAPKTWGNRFQRFPRLALPATCDAGASRKRSFKIRSTCVQCDPPRPGDEFIEHPFPRVLTGGVLNSRNYPHWQGPYIASLVGVDLGRRGSAGPTGVGGAKLPLCDTACVRRGSQLFSGYAIWPVVYRVGVQELPVVFHRAGDFAYWNVDDTDRVAVAGVSLEFLGVPAGVGGFC